MRTSDDVMMTTQATVLEAYYPIKSFKNILFRNSDFLNDGLIGSMDGSNQDMLAHHHQYVILYFASLLIDEEKAS